MPLASSWPGIRVPPLPGSARRPCCRKTWAVSFSEHIWNRENGQTGCVTDWTHIPVIYCLPWRKGAFLCSPGVTRQALWSWFWAGLCCGLLLDLGLQALLHTQLLLSELWLTPQVPSWVPRFLSLALCLRVSLCPAVSRFLLGLLRAGTLDAEMRWSGAFVNPCRYSVVLTGLELEVGSIWFGEGKPSGLQRCNHGCSLLNLFTSENIFFSWMCEKICSFCFPLTSWQWFSWIKFQSQKAHQVNSESVSPISSLRLCCLEFCCFYWFLIPEENKILLGAGILIHSFHSWWFCCPFSHNQCSSW